MIDQFSEGTYVGAFVVENDLEGHPIAEIFPEMPPDEFEEFKVDISGNGVIFPIVLWQGKILDGRARYRACRELSVEVWARKWEGGMDPVEYVRCVNHYRRHLTPEHRAEAWEKALNYHVEELKKRQTAMECPAVGARSSRQMDLPL